MEKEFVPYTEALELKELGFDKPCFGFYSKIYGLMMVKTSGSSSLYKDAGECLSPTFSQAFRWFREKYELEGITQQAEDFAWYKWKISQYNEDGKKYVADWYEYETYEEAELECIKKLIQIVKEKL
jgi:hypothetical protein